MHLAIQLCLSERLAKAQKKKKIEKNVRLKNNPKLPAAVDLYKYDTVMAERKWNRV